MKKQIGNDVRLEWTILRKGVAEDFTDATDLSLTAFIPNLSIDELILPIARVGNVFTLNIPTTDLSIGTYTIRLQYKKPDPAFASGKASISTAVNGAFQIVPIGASEDDLNDELTSNVVYCTDGATFIPSVSVVGNEVILSWTNDKGYENPLPINIKGDKGDVGKSAYEYYLESTTETTPLTEAEFSTMLGNLPTYVQDAILATSNANTAATDANNAANNATESASDADAAALLANNAAANADTKATYAQTQGGYAKAQGDYANAEGDYAHEQGLMAYMAANEANATNDSVQAAESLRVSAESSRVTAESNRVTQENDRIDAENLRESNEDGRISAESVRVTAESGRVTAEQTRQTNETARQTAETARNVASNVYNVTLAVPLTAGQYYTSTTARAAVPAGVRKRGLELVYEASAGVWFSERYIGSDVAAWTTAINWEVLPSKTYVIAKGDILKPTKNLFNKLDIINGYYIDTTTGSLGVNETSAVSNWISVDKSKVYYLSGRTASVNNVRFKDADGNILFPMQNATTPATNYSKTANTILYVPPTAVAVQFMVKYTGTGTYDSIQLEEGIAPTSYIEYGYLNELKESALPIEVKDIRAKRVGDLLYVAMPFSSTQEIVQRMNVFRNGLNDTLNNNVNFENEYLINKKADITIINTLLKNSSDDTAPTYLNGSYIGGNHGWNQPQKITKSAHGKTFSDIGKIATDSIGNQFTIIQILDANNFVLCAKNKATDGFTYNFPTPNGTLTFPEGAFSGYTFATMGNTFDFLKSISRKILVNGKTELLDGEEKYADYVDIIDMYDVYDLSTVVERLIANAGTYSSNPDFTAIGADKLFRMNITYRFIGNTCLFSHNFYNYKKLILSFLPFIQTTPFDSGNLYINKLLPLFDGVKTWDFRKGEVWTTPPATLLQLAKASWESATNAPDRFIQYTPAYAFATGFVKDKGYQRDANSSAGWLHTTRKIYPYGVYAGTITIEPYQSYSAQTYRSYQNRSGYPSGRISKVEWLDNGEYYVMIDWNATTFDTISLPKEVIGKQIQVIEKTSNVSILSIVAASEISFNAVIDTTNVYGYVVLKIK